MNIEPICHPSEIDVEDMLSHEQAYPDNFTLADRTAERMIRARAGLVHVMSELLPAVPADQGLEINCWLCRVLLIVDLVRLDAVGHE